MDKLRDFLKSWPGRILLVLCLSPLAILGIESYFHSSVDPNLLVKVGDNNVNVSAYKNAVNARRSEILEHLPDASMLNEDVLHEQVLKGLIDRALLEQQAGRLGMTVSDETITRLLQQEPGFQENGQFSNDRFAFFLQQRHMTKDQLFAEFRNQLILTQLNASIVGTAIYPMSAINQLIDLQTESRDVWLYRIPWQSFESQVKLTQADIQDYFNQHQNELKTQAMVDLSYVELSLDNIPMPEVTDADIQQQYQAFLQSINATDSRELSQILLTGADAAQKAADIKARLDKGEDFVKLAKQFSQDPTAESGGAIGQFNAVVFGEDAPAVEQALQGLGVGDVSQPVKTRFGYQIFKVTANHGEEIPTLQSVRAEMVEKAKEYKRQTLYAEKISAINNLAADGFGIEDIAQQEGLQIHALKDYPKTDNHTVLAQPAVINEAFNEFNLQNQGVTTSIDVANKTVWLQPSNYRPVASMTYEQATPKITQILTQQKASQLALQKANEIASGIKTVGDIANQSESFLALGKITRQSPVLSEKERSMAFSKPAPAGQDAVVALAEETEVGATVLVANHIQSQPQSQLSDIEKQQTAMIVRDNLGQDQLEDYLEYLRVVYPVEINQENMAGL